MTSSWAGSYVTVAASLMMYASESGGGLSVSSDLCPRTCFCNALSRIVYCSRRGLDAVPTALPRHTLQLNVNGNQFRSPVLRRANFSTPQAATIEHLYLSDCGIHTLKVCHRHAFNIVYAT